MLDKEQLDAVHLCLPHYLHSKVAIAAFERGVNVLTEKPMDVDLESAEGYTPKLQRKENGYVIQETLKGMESVVFICQ
jgi:predicted dehydrogenase